MFLLRAIPFGLREMLYVGYRVRLQENVKKTKC